MLSLPVTLSGKHQAAPPRRQLAAAAGHHGAGSGREPDDAAAGAHVGEHARSRPGFRIVRGRFAQRRANHRQPGRAPSPCTSSRCQVYDRTVLPTSLAFQTPAWWSANAWQYATDQSFSTTAANAIKGSGMAAADPQFLVEEIEEVADSLSVPPTGPPPSRIYYRISSGGQGGTAQAQVVLQSTFARRF